MVRDEKPAEVLFATGAGEDTARQQAVKQIERRRRFHVEFAVSVIGMVLQLTLTEHGTIPIHDWKRRIPS
jgi:hypothetical protein